MQKKSVYDIIKKQNGEDFAQAIRSFDSGIFDIANLPFIVKYAGRMAEPLFDFLVMLKNVQIDENVELRNPFELLKRAGYNAFLVTNLKEQNSIRKYFSKDEELCTFDEADRYQKYFVIHCIKEGAEYIERSNFTNPEREDLYARSVISIQISKRGGFIKITNRYNHKVQNPDNTFNSNPDNIIKGLSFALKNYFKVDFSSSQVPLPEGYLYLNGRIVEYDYEKDNVYYSTNYFIKDAKILEINKNYQLIFDKFILDLKEKEILNPLGEYDGLVKSISDEMRGKKLLVKKQGALNWSLFADGNEILHVQNNHLKKIFLPTLKYIPHCFLSYDNKVEEILAPNAVSVGRSSFRSVRLLKRLLLPRVVLMNEKCVTEAERLEEVFMPCLQKMGDNCFSGNTLHSNNTLEQICFPMLKKIGYDCFSDFKNIQKIYLPNCEFIGDFFGYQKDVFQDVYLPVLKRFPKKSYLDMGRQVFSPLIKINDNCSQKYFIEMFNKMKQREN